MFSLRKSAVGGGESAYMEALKVDPEEFDDQFDRWLKERFKPFRDKERPMDYGRNIAPKPGRTHFSSVLSLEASPSGDMLAAVVGNSRDYELDIVLLSAKNGDGDPEPDRRASITRGGSSTSPRPAACAATWCRGLRGRRSATRSRILRGPARSRRSCCINVANGEIETADPPRDGRWPGVTDVQSGRQARGVFGDPERRHRHFLRRTLRPASSPT